MVPNGTSMKILWTWMVYDGKLNEHHIQMDDNWGYPYLRKPPIGNINPVYTLDTGFIDHGFIDQTFMDWWLELIYGSCDAKVQLQWSKVIQSDPNWSKLIQPADLIDIFPWISSTCHFPGTHYRSWTAPLTDGMNGTTYSYEVDAGRAREMSMFSAMDVVWMLC